MLPIPKSTARVLRTSVALQEKVRLAEGYSSAIGGVFHIMYPITGTIWTGQYCDTDKLKLRIHARRI